MKCEDCRFWKRLESEPEKGLCRRFPPTWYTTTKYLDGETEVDSDAYFPTIKKDDWCGEFKINV